MTNDAWGITSHWQIIWAERRGFVVVRIMEVLLRLWVQNFLAFASSWAVETQPCYKVGLYALLNDQGLHFIPLCHILSPSP